MCEILPISHVKRPVEKALLLENTYRVNAEKIFAAIRKVTQ